MLLPVTSLLEQGGKRCAAGPFPPEIRAAAQLQVEHGPLHEQVAVVLFGQSDPAVQLDSLFRHQPIKIGGMCLQRQITPGIMIRSLFAALRS